MPPPKAPISDHFLSGKKQNGSHVRAHCRGCIEKEWPDGDMVELDADGKPKLSSQSWVIEGTYHLLHVWRLANVVTDMKQHAKETLVVYSVSGTP